MTSTKWATRRSLTAGFTPGFFLVVSWCVCVYVCFCILSLAGPLYVWSGASRIPNFTCFVSFAFMRLRGGEKNLLFLDFLRVGKRFSLSWFLYCGSCLFCFCSCWCSLISLHSYLFVCLFVCLFRCARVLCLVCFLIMITSLFWLMFYIC